jgi:GrpB-like predicted nucleotidyltransferase (UPF0157 family)
MTKEIEIHSYAELPATYSNYDPEVSVVAGALITLIVGKDNWLQVEHIGSTAVPGCAGKGYIDLLVIYQDGHLEVAKRVLQELGFERQRSRDPFPEDRPMRVGSVMHKGKRYPIHAHVVAEASPEVSELLRFRDRLRSNERLRAAYETEKRRILAAGITDGVDYANSKGDFIRGVLAEQ